jgi:hypothetical protein
MDIKELYRARDRLAKLLEIPESMRDDFLGSLEDAVDFTNMDFYRYKPFSKRRDPAFRAIAMALRKAKGAISDLDAKDRDLIELAWHDHLPMELVWKSEFFGTFPRIRGGNFMACLESALNALDGLIGRNPGAGRARGNRAVRDVADWRFHRLMASLFSWRERFGARVPFNPKKPNGGDTFQKIIQLLDELVPGVIPRNLPLSTIRDIRKPPRGRQKR